MSYRITYIAGISNKVKIVDPTSPNPKLTTQGCRNCAWILFSKSIGVIPKQVVTEVRNIAMNRSCPDLDTASIMGLPALILRFMNSISKSELFTTIPARATNPNILIMVNFIQMNM